MNSLRQKALRQIADALGKPVECFFADPVSTQSSVDAGECLRLWSEIKSDEGRRQALQALRAIVELDHGPRSDDL